MIINRAPPSLSFFCTISMEDTKDSISELEILYLSTYRYCFAYFIETDMFYIIVERIFFFSPYKILIKRSHVYFVMFGGEGAINKFQSVCDWKNLEQILEGRIAGGKRFYLRRNISYPWKIPFYKFFSYLTLYYLRIILRFFVNKNKYFFYPLSNSKFRALFFFSVLINRRGKKDLKQD